MNTLSSYCGLVDAKIRAPDKDLPVPLTKLASKATKVKSISNSLNVMMIRRQLIGITWNFELFSTTVITKFLSTSQKTQISSNGLLLKFGQ